MNLFAKICLLFLGGVLGLTVILAGCKKTEMAEVVRLVSPDEKVEAVLLVANPHATEPFYHYIYITPSGAKIKEDKYLFKVDHAGNLRAEWRENKVLEIFFDEARIYHFRNYWQSKDVNNYRYVVELRLVPGNPNFSLSERDRWVK